MISYSDETFSVRYIVDDVPAALVFYRDRLGLGVALDRSPEFAVLARGALRLLLSAPTGGGGAARAMPDGRRPRAGGWNRIQLSVDDLAGAVARLRADGVTFRGDVVAGRGGSQVLVEDPSGNPVELFQPAAR